MQRMAATRTESYGRFADLKENLSCVDTVVENGAPAGRRWRTGGARTARTRWRNCRILRLRSRFGRFRFSMLRLCRLEATPLKGR